MHRRGVMLLQICNSRQIKFAVAILCLCILCSRSSATADGPRDAMCQSKYLQLLHSSVGTTCTTSSEQIEVMESKGYSRPTCNKLCVFSHDSLEQYTDVLVWQNFLSPKCRNYSLIPDHADSTVSHHKANCQPVC